MRIEFKLPTRAGGWSMHQPCSLLHRELARWCEYHGFGYEETLDTYSVSIRFHDDRAYTMFALTWQYPKPDWHIRDD